MSAVRQMEENELAGRVTRTETVRKHFVAGEERA